MDRRFHLLAALSVLALGAVSGSQPVESATFAGVNLDNCIVETARSEPECACEAALESGKAEDLARFLEIYASEASNTACTALATTIDPPKNENRYGG